MGKTIAELISKATSNGATVANGFTHSKIRQGINTLRDGDIITFPSDLTGKVITEQMKQHGEPVMREDENGNQVPVILEYMFVTVNRGGHETSVPFYPSAFTKSREIADSIGGDGIGVYERADGDVVDLVSSFDEEEIDEAIKAIAAKGKVKVTLRNIIGVDFNTKKGKKMTLPTFSWAE